MSLKLRPVDAPNRPKPKLLLLRNLYFILKYIHWRLVYNRNSKYWIDPDEEEIGPDFRNWTNETQTYIANVKQQLINLEKSTSIMNVAAVTAQYQESIKRRHVIMGKDGKWIAVDESFTKNSEAERYVVCESTDKYQRLIVNGW